MIYGPRYYKSDEKERALIHCMSVKDLETCMARIKVDPRPLLFYLREFLMYLQRYKSFFAALPEMLCEGENVVEDSTCWSGDDVVER